MVVALTVFTLMTAVADETAVVVDVKAGVVDDDMDPTGRTAPPLMETYRDLPHGKFGSWSSHSQSVR